MRSILRTLAVVLVASRVEATQGYTSRASGFDATIGGATVCRGTNTSSTVGQDVDSNGVNDRQVYVDLTSGTNSASCGLPGSPCLTVNYALNGTNSSVAGGQIQSPSANQIQAVCVKGVGREAVTLTQSGASGSYSVSATGSQVRAFNHPRFPFILSGWDADNDGDYPPHDAGDTARLQGDSGGASLDIAIDLGSLSNIEIAHLSVTNYGLTCPTTGGAFLLPHGGGTPATIYIHDIETNAINKSCANTSNEIVYNFFGQSSIYSYIDISNVKSTQTGGGYFLRGSAGGIGNVAGPIRLQNATVENFGATGDAVDGIKLFLDITGLEVLDNIFDNKPNDWSPGHCCQGFSIPFAPSMCLQDAVFRNNLVTDFPAFAVILPYYGSAGQCEDRGMTGIVFDRNVFRSTYDNGSGNNYGVTIQPGLNTTVTLTGAGALKFTNNFFSWTVNPNSAIWDMNGNNSGAQDNTLVIAGNTFDCGSGSVTKAMLYMAESGLTHKTHDFILKDNIVSNCGSQTAIKLDFTPAGAWTSDYAAFGSSNVFGWNGSSGQSFATWKSNSGGDTNSKQGTPTFVNSAAGNFRLDTGDTVAKAAGTAISSYTTVDIDGNTRATPTSIGGHDPNAGSSTPSIPVHVRATSAIQLRWDQLTSDTVTGFRVCLDGQTGTNCPDVGLPTGASVADTWTGYTTYTIPFISVSAGHHVITVEAYNGASLSSTSGPFGFNAYWRHD